MTWIVDNKEVKLRCVANYPGEDVGRLVNELDEIAYLEKVEDLKAEIASQAESVTAL